MPAVSVAARVSAPASARARERLRAWWPLAALVLLAAALRLATLDLQSFWYDEAFTPVRVLHTSVGATLRSVVHTENSPPLWYLIAWLDARLLGDGELALRLPSALAGIATVGVAWAIGQELAGRRCAVVTAALVVIVIYLLWRTWQGYDWIAASGWTLLAISVTSTWLLAWYILWPLPLAVIARDRRLLVATLAVQAMFIAHQLAPLIAPVS